MFSSTRRLGVFTLIIAAINAFMGAMLLIYISSVTFLAFAEKFYLTVFILSVPITLIIVGIALFCLGQDLNMSQDCNAAESAKLKKRVDILEQR